MTLRKIMCWGMYDPKLKVIIDFAQTKKGLAHLTHPEWVHVKMTGFYVPKPKRRDRPSHGNEE